MNILVACEESGIVRDAFIARGHAAISCDLLPTRRPGPHYQGDVRDILDEHWDMMIAFPPCTDLAVSGARHFPAKRKDGRQKASAEFFMFLVNAPIPIIAVENPVCIMSTRYRKPDQIIQPWMFGHKEQKATCLWLKNLPKLVPTDNVYEAMMQLPKRERERVHNLPRTKDRARIRSTTYQGIADAMAAQWG